MRISRKTSFAAGAIFALVVGSGTAFAATGGTFILGKSNTAGRVTTLTNKNGTALALGSKAGTPPLKVGNGVKVARLNADKLDGKDNTAFALASGRTGYVTATGQWYDLDGDTVNDAIVAFAQCPAGTRLTGGGQSDFTTNGYIITSGPVGSGVWGVAAAADSGEDPANVESYAVCYNPRGAVSGGSATAARTTSNADARSAFLQKVSRAAAARK